MVVCVAAARTFREGTLVRFVSTPASTIAGRRIAGKIIRMNPLHRPLALRATTILAAALCFAGCGGGGGGAGGSGAPPPAPSCAAIAAAPTSLVASSVTASGLVLSWSATAPANCSLSFDVYQGGAKVASGVTAGSWTATGLAATTAYTFTVDAADSVGASPQSAALAVTTSAAGTIFNGITITGKLIWHSYAAYGFSGVQSWMANFDTGQVSEITPARITGAMNYHFNPDGTQVVVMGSDANQTSLAWDLFVATVTASGLTNVTKITNAAAGASNFRFEDPKFSSDGTKIIFKKDNTSIASIDTASFTVNGVNQTPPVTVLWTDSAGTSMPYYLGGSDTNFVFANDTANTIQYDAAGAVTTLYNNAFPGVTAGQHNYYPIAIDATTFYFASGMTHDWIFRGDTGAGPTVLAAFIDGTNNNYEFADPFPMSPSWLAYTSTLPGGGSAGSYDIWIGNFATGVKFNLNSWIRGSNRPNSDLGPTFHGTISP